MPHSPARLPDDPAALKAMIAALQAEKAAAETALAVAQREASAAEKAVPQLQGDVASLKATAPRARGSGPGAPPADRPVEAAEVRLPFEEDRPRDRAVGTGAREPRGRPSQYPRRDALGGGRGTSRLRHAPGFHPGRAAAIPVLRPKPRARGSCSIRARTARIAARPCA